MIKNKKRFFSLLITGVLAVSTLSGCSSLTEASEEKETSKAMGRYLETDISLPENTREAYDLVKMEDGSLRLSTIDSKSNAAVWELNNEDNSWDKVFEFTIEEPGYKTYFSSIALSPQGGSFVTGSMGKDSDEGDPDSKIVFFAIDEEGGKREVSLEVQYPYFTSADKNGNYYVADLSEISRLDIETGSKQIIVPSELKPSYFGLAGDTLYIISKDGEIASYGIDSGEIFPQDEALNEAVKQSGMNLQITSSSCMPLVFSGGKDEETVFFCGNAGLFRHTKSGSVTEKLIEGTLTSLGKPEIGFKAMEVMEDETIYVLARDSDKPRLMKYAYSADTSTLPEQELKVYTLYESPELQQAISVYQKENPQVYITLETAITGEDGVTASDALRTLSTEIMAGKGPDLLLMDGLPLESYIEKGMLLEISDIVDKVNQEEGLFTNITSAFETEDGEMYAVPLRFYMPVLEGSKETLDHVKDLKTLADEAERLSRENPDKYIINPFQSGMTIAAQLYDACSAAWLNEDGTVNEEMLKDFYSQVKRIYSLYDWRGDARDYKEWGHIQSTSGISAGSMDMYCDKSILNFGNMNAMWELQALATTSADREDISYDILNAQMKNTFLPGCIAGINSKSTKIKEISDFLELLLRESAQAVGQGNGMPVNRKGMEELLRKSVDDNEVSISGSSNNDDPDNYMEMEVRGLTEEDCRIFLEKVEQLENPSLSNEIVREAVLEQANDCVTEKISVDEAVKRVVDKVNLYLAEG